MSSLKRKIVLLTLHIPVVIIGVGIPLKGMEKLERLGHHPVVVTILLLLGGFVVLGAFLAFWLEKRIENAHALAHAAEGVAMSLRRFVLFEKGKLRMPLLLLFVGFLFVVIGYVESKPQEQRERLTGPVLKGTAWAALAGGVSRSSLHWETGILGPSAWRASS